MDFPSHKPKRMEFIEQRKKSDCGVACAAMLCDRLYGEVIAVAQALGINIKRGMFPEEMFELIEEFGKYCARIDKIPNIGRALIAIRWKQKTLSEHYVVWDAKRKQFLDPLHGVYGKREFFKFAEIDSIWKITKN